MIICIHCRNTLDNGHCDKCFPIPPQEHKGQVALSEVQAAAMRIREALSLSYSIPWGSIAESLVIVDGVNAWRWLNEHIFNVRAKEEG